MHLDPFTSIAVIATIGALLVWVVQRLGQSPIVAYLGLGLLIGPSGLNLFQTSAGVQHFAEIGVLFLLFFVGLEFHLGALREMAAFAVLGSLLQVGLTASALGLAALGLGFPLPAALLAGLCGGFSSTAIVMKALEDRREADSATGSACVGLLIGQDLIALTALAILPFALGLEAESVVPLPAPLAMILLVVALPALFFTVRAVVPRLFERAAAARNPEVFALASLGACLLVAVAGRAVGASLALGAFLGGLVFAGTPYAHQIRADLSVFRNLALGFFFVAVGMLLDLQYCAEHALLLVLAFLAVVVVKAFLAFFTVWRFGRPLGVAVGAGVALAQMSEFGLVLVALGARGGLFSPAHFQFLSALTVLTMLAAPFLVARARGFGAWVSGLREEAAPLLPSAGALEAHAEGSDIEAPAHSRVSAIVVGYGPVGRTLSRILIRFGVRPIVIDLHLPTVKRLHALGREAVFGDAARREVFVAAGIHSARFLLVTLPDFPSRASVLTTARHLNPAITILSRARYLTEQEPLRQLGADDVATEETDVACDLARRLLERLRVDRAQVDDEVSKIASEIVTRSGFTRVMPSPFASGAPEPEGHLPRGS
jgi:CPA2 family monovalent cation:H+ antiporter-2